MAKWIKEVYIKNFKRFKGEFRLTLNPTFNILVGDNEAGKSTILEAINLALTGTMGGRYLQNELSQHIFNIDAVQEYLDSLVSDKPINLPEIAIELYFGDEESPLLKGNGNSRREDAYGLRLEVIFDEDYKAEYEELSKQNTLKTLPIEYYSVRCYSFAREHITSRSIPIKPAFIDSSNTRFQNGSDINITKIVRDSLESSELVNIAQAYRNASETFMNDGAIDAINQKIKALGKISDKDVKIGIYLPAKNAWEMAITTYFNTVPFHLIGKGEQCIVKTKLAIGHKKSQEANIILMEEPENHLSHTKLNALLKNIKDDNTNKQIIITTHSSFVANKLGLENIIVLNDNKSLQLADLSEDTKKFFTKLAGYDTLRLILCRKAILVEGDSDELIIQRAYMDANNGKLPIEDGIDVISVGTSFLRFLEIAKQIDKPVNVVTDNDGEIDALKNKYSDYLGVNGKGTINICFDDEVHLGSLKIGDKPFNYNTLEPCIFRANGCSTLNNILQTKHGTDDELLKYMHNYKTECALAIFENTKKINYPQYIKDAIK